MDEEMMVMHSVSKARGRLRGRWFTAAALLGALVAAVTVAVEPPGAASGQSGDSGGSPATPTTTAASVDPPEAPERFRAVLSEGSVFLDWLNPGDNTITKYQYRIKTVGAGAGYGEWTDIPGSGATSIGYNIRGVTGSGRRNVQLRAVNAGGAGVHAVASTEVPAAPSRLRASLTGGLVSLSWDDPGDDSIAWYQYRIKEAGSSNSYGLWTTIAGSGSSTTSASISVTGNGRRVIELQAQLAVNPGWGAISKSAWASTGPPAQPSGFNTPGGTSSGGNVPLVTAPAGSPKGEVDLRWSDPGDDSIIKYQYKIRPDRSGTVDSRWIDIPGSGASTTGYKFVVPTSEQYRFQLRAVSSAGATVKAIKVKPAWPALAAPSGLKATLSGSSIALSWDNPFDDNVSKYQYRVKTVGAGNAYSSWADIADSAIVGGDSDPTFSTTITVTGSGRRNVQLRAKGDKNLIATASTGPPTQPSGFNIPGGRYYESDWGRQVHAPASSPKGEINLRWSDPGDESIIKYQYEIRPTGTAGSNGSQWIDIPGSGASTTGYKFVLPTDQGYRFYLRAVNNAGAAFTKSTVHSSWPAAVAAPLGLKATLSGRTVTLSWDNPFNDNIRGYQYRIKTVGTGNAYSSWTDIADSAIVGGDNGPTFSTAISVTGSGQRTVQLRVNRDNNSVATASTG